MNIEDIAGMISEDPDEYNEAAEDMATRLRRHLVRHHTLEEYDIKINSEDHELGDSDDEVWKFRHNMMYKPFVLSIRRDILGARETKMILDNTKDFLARTDWKVVNSEVGPHVFEITVSPK